MKGVRLYELLRGALYFFSRLSGNLEVSTAFVNAGVEGTEGLVKIDAIARSSQSSKARSSLPTQPEVSPSPADNRPSRAKAARRF